ncbi:MAG: AMP-binding protein [Solirubrobacteraceae bacterium]|nr:AMP-binding protein [Solirubrobacteraceae bacterium]
MPEPVAAATALRALPATERTLPALLERQAREHGDRPLLAIGGERRSHREMRDAVARAAGALRAVGIGRGDRVAMLCANHAELLDAVLGCAWIGAIAVPLNTAARGEQLRHMLHDADPRLVLVDADLRDVLDTIAPWPAHEATWVVGGAPAEAPPRDAAPVPPAPVGPGDPMVVLYTSGTTGPSKGVVCPHAQFFWWGVLVGEHLEIGADDVLFTCLPLFHTNALNAFFQALVAGASIAIVPRFSASRFWRQAAEAGATVTYLLGAMVNILCSREPTPEERGHRVRVALAPATPAHLHAAFRDRFGVTLVEGYGSTETNLVICARPSEQRPGLLGRVLDEFEVAVVDEHDAPVPDGEAGELLVRHREPFSVANGYFGLPGKTAEAWRNLWFHTGDRVVRQPDGWLRFLDRTKDAIRRRGENISSFEVEQAIASHPAVAAVAVFPVPSEMAEDEVMAAVVPRPGHALAPVDVVRHCEGRLAYFAIPRYVDVVDDLPRTENGKIRKAALREAGVTPTTWDREAAGYRLAR